MVWCTLTLTPPVARVVPRVKTVIRAWGPIPAHAPIKARPDQELVVGLRFFPDGTYLAGTTF